MSDRTVRVVLVSMKSGLEGRNNGCPQRWDLLSACVSMKSGLEGRNNCMHGYIVEVLCRLSQ